MTSTIDGPAWAQQGLDQREGRYPLAVEAPVLSMVAMLVPGLSTLTQFARYYSLYWALADAAGRDELDAASCRRLVRRSEILFARAAMRDDRGAVPHGADAIARGRQGGRSLQELAEDGKGSYSPRPWGFWSQYGGPADVLGTATTDGGALRPARHPCPPEVKAVFGPLLEMATSGREVSDDVLSAWGAFSLNRRDTPDLVALRDVFSATRGGVHDPAAWTPEDRARRSSLRILARSAVLVPDAAHHLDAMREAVAYGPAVTSDPVLSGEGERTEAWRGLLLRHWSVGAWRRLWAGLVEHVKGEGPVTRSELHDWMADRLPDQSVEAATRELPRTVDESGHPTPAEVEIRGRLAPVHADVAVLMAGARRRTELRGAAQVAFLGGKQAGRGTFLDPTWVAMRVADHAAAPMRDLGRVLVDDMLAQSRRVALRKVQVREGRFQMFSRLHERNDTYTARTGEGSGNVGLRVEQLAAIAEQLGLVGRAGGLPITPLGSAILEVPA